MAAPHAAPKRGIGSRSLLLDERRPPRRRIDRVAEQFCSSSAAVLFVTHDRASFESPDADRGMTRRPLVSRVLYHLPGKNAAALETESGISAARQKLAQEDAWCGRREARRTRNEDGQGAMALRAERAARPRRSATCAWRSTRRRDRTWFRGERVGSRKAVCPCPRLSQRILRANRAADRAQRWAIHAAAPHRAGERADVAPSAPHAPRHAYSIRSGELAPDLPRRYHTMATTSNRHGSPSTSSLPG